MSEKMPEVFVTFRFGDNSCVVKWANGRLKQVIEKRSLASTLDGISNGYSSPLIVHVEEIT